MIKKYDQFLNEELNIPKYILDAPKTVYCSVCHTLSDNDICRYCKVLNILGIDKEHDDNNVYGELKSKERFFKNKLQPYIDSLKKEYDLTDEQINEIKNILKIN